MMSRKVVEQKAREIATNTFSDGTMRTMLYERILDAFTDRQAAPRSDCTREAYVAGTTAYPCECSACVRNVLDRRARDAT